MQKTWKATVGGILAIVGGTFNIAAALGISLSLPVMAPFKIALLYTGAVTAVLLATGIVALLGGISAVQRRRWGLALAGAICAIFPISTLLGIVSTVFIAMARDEFASAPSQASKPPQLPVAGKESGDTSPGPQPIPCNPDFSQPGEGEQNA